MTGGVATGKSTFVRMLAERGLQTVSADDVAREVRSDPAVRRRLALDFGVGEENLEDGLRLALADPAARRKLNAILHPLVWTKLQSTPHDVAEIPLLVETCVYDAYDYAVLVTCGHDEQVKRLVDRLGSEAAANRVIHSQLVDRAKAPFADEVVRTDQGADHVQQVAGRICALFSGST